jgi:putative ABC transport system permease protein
MYRLTQDLRYAVRTMLKRPAFTLIAVVTLALGIGGSTAIFTIVDAALLRGLPYKSPDRLYHLFETTPQKEFNQREFSYPDYVDYQNNQVLDGLAAYTGLNAIMSGRGESERVFAPLASANFFSVLGVEPILGRTFQPGEDKPGAPRVVVLTYGMWQRRFGGDPGVVGQSLNINGDDYTVVGVLPASFQFAMRASDMWRTYQPTDNQRTRRSMHGTNLIGRLKPGVTAQQAQSELSVITKRIEQENMASHANTGLRLVPLQENVVGQVKPILFVLLTAVGFVLLIACANVASLLLTRSLGRQKEVAIRAAMGASRARVVRQLLTESLLLSVIGGVAGLVVAYWGVHGLVAALPDNQINSLPFLKTLHLDVRILLFSFSLSLLTGIIFGLVPALQSSRPDLNEVLKEGGRNTTGGSSHRLRGALVVSEIALAVVLLVGAGLMMKSLLRLLQTNIGFNPDNLLTMYIALPAAKYTEINKQIDYFDQLKARVESLPGVKDSGTVNILPLQAGNTTRFNVEGDPVPPPGQEVEANIRVVDENYFKTLGVPLLAGRMFDERDKANTPNPTNTPSPTNAANATNVVIIGKTTADKVFAGRDPIGRRLVYTGVQAPPITVVGVVGNVKIGGLDDDLRPVLYYPFRQNPGPGTTLVVRTTNDPNTLAAAVRNEIRSLEPDVAIFNVKAMGQVISDTPAAFMRRFPALLIGIFAGVALLLASIGIYGVVSYSVSQQTHYIGVRMALGAQASDILKMVLRQGLTLAVIGMVLGIIAALGLTRWLRALLFEVQTTDLTTFAIVLGSLFVVALLACYIPARRATKVDPLVALRYE